MLYDELHLANRLQSSAVVEAARLPPRPRRALPYCRILARFSEVPGAEDELALAVGYTPTRVVSGVAYKSRTRLRSALLETQ